MRITKSQFDFIDGYREHTNDSPTWKEEMLDDHIDALENNGNYRPNEKVKLFLNEISTEKLEKILSMWDETIEVED